MQRAVAAVVRKDGPQEDVVQRALASIRKHLDMEVAYLSKFEGEETVFQRVDAPGREHLLKPGDRMPLESVYCGHILAGRLPSLMADTSAFPTARAMAITQQVPIGSHISIPISRPNGETYGMFCCLSSNPNASLNERDLETMRMFADLAAEVVLADEERAQDGAVARNRIDALIETKNFHHVYQPIIELISGRIWGYEALSRFEAEPHRSPDQWFSEAVGAGRGLELESATTRAALESIAAVPTEAVLSLNASPRALLDPTFRSLLLNADLSRVMLEITEHEEVEDYGALLNALAPLRDRGISLAIDDAGAGYSSLQHILRLRPDIIKLDMALTRDIDSDPSRRSLAKAMVYFAKETGARVLAEGIETEAEAGALRELGADMGQGYLLGRPQKSFA